MDWSDILGESFKWLINFKVRTLFNIFNNRYHDAFKKIKYYSPKTNEIVTPTTENGYKFELFIFDAFEIAPTFAILHVPRETEFAPIKNPIGSKSDAPEHAV